MLSMLSVEIVFGLNLDSKHCSEFPQFAIIIIIIIIIIIMIILNYTSKCRPASKPNIDLQIY